MVRRARWRWILAVSVGEAAGFAVAAATAVLTIGLDVPPTAQLVAVVLAGCVEGAALATGQYLGMTARRPPARRWVGATALAAGCAWTLGMLPSTLGVDLGSPSVLVLMGVGAVVLLASIPVVQWVVLARPDARAWVPVTMLAWTVAILWTFAPSPFVDEATPAGQVAVVYVVAGALMAVTFAVVTAPLAVRLFGPDPHDGS